MRALIALLLVALAFAGCADESAPEPVPSNATPGFEVAEAAAHKWNDEAYLVDLVTIENHEAMDAPGYEGKIAQALGAYPDHTPLDGIASAWLYVFSDGAQGYGVVANDAAGVLAKGEMDATTTPLGFPAFSSDDAGRRLAEEASAWLGNQSAPFTTRYRDASEPVWVFSGAEAAQAHYVTEKCVLPPMAWEQQIAPIPNAAETKSLGNGQSHTIALHVPCMHGFLNVFVDWADAPTVGTLAVDIVDPSGAIATSERLETNALDSNPIVFDIPNPMWGEWRIEMTLEQGLSANVQAALCGPSANEQERAPCQPAL